MSVVVDSLTSAAGEDDDDDDDDGVVEVEVEALPRTPSKTPAEVLVEDEAFSRRSKPSPPSRPLVVVLDASAALAVDAVTTSSSDALDVEFDGSDLSELDFTSSVAFAIVVVALLVVMGSCLAVLDDSDSVFSAGVPIFFAALEIVRLNVAVSVVPEAVFVVAFFAAWERTVSGKTSAIVME